MSVLEFFKKKSGVKNVSLLSLYLIVFNLLHMCVSYVSSLPNVLPKPCPRAPETTLNVAKLLLLMTRPGSIIAQ